MADQARHYDGVSTFSGSQTGPGNRTNVIAAKELLRFARAHDIFTPVCAKKKVPKNVAETARWRRIVPDTVASNPTEITEGVNPDWQGITYEDVSKTFEERVEIYAVTSRARTLGEDDHVANSITQLKDKVLRIRTAVAWNEYIAGTNVQYNDASHSARTDVDGPVTGAALQEAVRKLHAEKADVFREVDNGGLNNGTVGLEPTYAALTSTDLLPDFRAIEGFTTPNQYGGSEAMSPLERGAVENIRVLMSPELTPIANAGAAVGSTNMKSTGGSNIDVYLILICGRDALGQADLMGEGQGGYGNVKINTISKGDHSDPAGLNTLVVAHWWDAPVILNDAWVRRLEVGATDDLGA